MNRLASYGFASAVVLAPGDQDIDDLARLQETAALLEAASTSELTEAQRDELIELHHTALTKAHRVSARLEIRLTLSLVRQALASTPPGNTPPQAETLRHLLENLESALETLHDEPQARTDRDALLERLLPPVGPGGPAAPRTPPPSMAADDEAPAPGPTAAVAHARPLDVPPEAHVTPRVAAQSARSWIAVVATGSVSVAAGVGLIVYGGVGPAIAERRVREHPTPSNEEWLEEHVPRLQGALFGAGIGALGLGASLLANGILMRARQGRARQAGLTLAGSDRHLSLQLRRAF